MKRFTRGEIFMNQETINVKLLATDVDTDVLRFHIDNDAQDVNLNSATCQNALKNIFSKLLKKLISSNISLSFTVSSDYTRVMYKEVCEEFIKDLERELSEVKEELLTELS